MGFHSRTPYDELGAVFGVISILALLCHIVYLLLPARLLKKLLGVLDEAEALCAKAAEQGLPIQTCADSLQEHRNKANEFQHDVDCYTSRFDACMGLMAGLSWKIYQECVKVRKIRAQIATAMTEPEMGHHQLPVRDPASIRMQPIDGSARHLDTTSSSPVYDTDGTNPSGVGPRQHGSGNPESVTPSKEVGAVDNAKGQHGSADLESVTPSNDADAFTEGSPRR